MDFLRAIFVEINNREISIIIWVTALFLWGVSKKDVRNSLLNVLKAFCTPKIILPFLIIISYVVLSVVVFSKVTFWEKFLLKDTIIWFFIVAFVMFVDINKAHKEDQFFKKIIKDNIKMFVVIQFIVNTYVFGLAAELILTPVTTILVMATAITENNNEMLPAHNLITKIIGLIIVIFIAFSFYNVFIDYKNFFVSSTFKKFTMPLVLTLIFIPVIYFMAVIFLYETIFTMLSFKTYYAKNLKTIKYKVIFTCRLNLDRLKKFNEIMYKFDLSTNEGLSLAMGKIKHTSKKV